MGPTSSASAGTAAICVQLTVALDDDGRPVGRIATDGADSVAFTGWLALTAELSRRLAAGDSHPSAAAHDLVAFGAP
jgi:hypothetical protein